MLTKIQKLFLSFFGIGFIPFAPGTWGSAATLPILYYLQLYKVPMILCIPFFIFVTGGTCVVTEWFQRKHKLHDPGWIVIDEVLGMIAAYMFVFHIDSQVMLIYLFIIFRIFDIFKVYPATFFDKMEHGAGTILDDIVSGIFTGVSLLILHALLPQIF